MFEEMIRNTKSSWYKLLSENMENLYEEYPEVNYADVKFIEGSGFDIKLNVDFDPKDKRQNIPLLYAYGGGTETKEGKIVKIQPDKRLKDLL